jgi:polyhydroxybutyrate depolymerase
MLRRASLLLLALAACLPAPPSSPPRARKPEPDQVVFGGERPVKLFVPTTYDHGSPATLVLLLHGLSATGWLQAAYFGLDVFAEEEGALLLAPDGTPMPRNAGFATEGAQFWNGTDACCDFAKTGVDDVAYLTGLVREVVAEYNVDEDRVFVVGHSNGGFMGYRLACEHPELFAGIVSVAGATFDDPAKCAPARPIHVAQIHGTLDDVVFYEGEEFDGYTYPSATKTAAMWGTYNGCTGHLGVAGPAFEIETTTDGPETSVRAVSGCPAAGSAELWTMEGAGHIPTFGADFRRQLAGWFARHPRSPVP